MSSVRLAMYVAVKRFWLALGSPALGEVLACEPAQTDSDLLSSERWRGVFSASVTTEE
ncbi:MAG: hypothetical protein ABI877_22560 [Gemmatimonadaceae bacterium]